MRRSRSRAVSAALLAGAMFKVGGQFADAGEVSWEGDSYSLGMNGNYLKVCDKVDDGRWVHNDAISTVLNHQENNVLTDKDGANDSCPEFGPINFPFWKKHRAVTEISFWPDRFGPWASAL